MGACEHQLTAKSQWHSPSLLFFEENVLDVHLLNSLLVLEACRKGSIFEWGKTSDCFGRIQILICMASGKTTAKRGPGWQGQKLNWLTGSTVLFFRANCLQFHFYQYRLFPYRAYMTNINCPPIPVQFQWLISVKLGVQNWQEDRNLGLAIIYLSMALSVWPLPFVLLGILAW